jgi:ABC-type tungstate transport system permease subunit
MFVLIPLQVPWALAQSKWYHQYPRFPQEAIRAASSLSEYTLTDRGTWLTAPKSITSQLRIYKMGSDDANDLLLNAAHLLYGARTPASHAEICREFLDWIVSPRGGQTVIENFSKHGQAVYSKAP